MSAATLNRIKSFIQSVLPGTDVYFCQNYAPIYTVSDFPWWKRLWYALRNKPGSDVKWRSSLAYVLIVHSAGWENNDLIQALADSKRPVGVNVQAVPLGEYGVWTRHSEPTS